MFFKTCNKCLKEKSIEKFGFAGKKYRKNTCYSCISKRKLSSPQARAYQKKYREDHKQYFADKHREWRKKNKKQFSVNIYFQKFKAKHNIQPGKCAVCDSLITEAHHPDYDEKLLIIWLCKKHHESVHTKEIPLSSIISKAVCYG